MYEKTTFRVDHPTGYIEVDVREFFGSADKRRIKKLLRLASQNCSEEQKADLINTLSRMTQEMTEALDAVGSLEYSRCQILAPFFGPYATERPLGSHEKLLVKQREKIKDCINLLLKERWTG